MATKKDLIREVNRLNKKYCNNKKIRNKFIIHQGYGSKYEVGLTGKKTKTGKYYKGSLGNGIVSITNGHDTATNTLNDLYKSDSKGWVAEKVYHYNKKR